MTDYKKLIECQGASNGVNKEWLEQGIAATTKFWKGKAMVTVTLSVLVMALGGGRDA